MVCKLHFCLCRVKLQHFCECQITNDCLAAIGLYNVDILGNNSCSRDGKVCFICKDLGVEIRKCDIPEVTFKIAAWQYFECTLVIFFTVIYVL